MSWMEVSRPQRRQNHELIRFADRTVAAYAVVKAILPFRLMISISGTPWFARHIVTPILSTFRRKKAVSST